MVYRVMTLGLYYDYESVNAKCKQCEGSIVYTSELNYLKHIMINFAS